MLFYIQFHLFQIQLFYLNWIAFFIIRTRFFSNQPRFFLNRGEKGEDSVQTLPIRDQQFEMMMPDWLKLSGYGNFHKKRPCI